MSHKVKQSRRISTPFDKTKASFAAFLNLAAARIWLRDFVNRAENPQPLHSSYLNVA